MKRISIAISMIAIGVAVGILVFGFGTLGDDEGTRGATDNSYMDTATYEGSLANCEMCHNDDTWDFKYDHWDASLHSKMIQSPTPTTVIGDFTAPIVLNDTANGIPDVTIDLDDTGGVFTVTMDGNAFVVDYTVGSAWKQRYLVQINASMYFLPIQWNVDTAEFVAYHLERWYDTNGNIVPWPSDTRDSWDRNCAGCHTTGTDVTYNAGTNEWTATWAELNIGCEACHGPGGDHNGNTLYIWKSVDAQICGSCHIRGTSNGTLAGSTDPLGYPWNDVEGWYMPGDTLSDYYVPGEGTWGDEHDSSSKHHQQYRDWLTTESNGHAEIAPVYSQRTDCMSCRSTEGFINYTGGPAAPDAGNATWKLTCAACHSSHDDAGNEHQLRLAQDELCVACHTIGTQELDHTPHHAQKEIIEGQTILNLPGTPKPWMGGMVTCVDCHMIGTAQSALPGDISSHTFKVIMPNQTALTGVPNSCNSYCHNGGPGHALNDTAAQDDIIAWVDEIHPLEVSVGVNVTAAEAAFEEAQDQLFSTADLAAAEDALNRALFAYGVVESGIGTAHNHIYAHDLLDFANGKANEVVDALVNGTLKGRIVDINNQSIADANITSGDWYTHTDSNGEFEVYLAPGTHSFSVLVDGVEEGTFDGTVVAGNVTDLGDIQVGEAPPPPPPEDDEEEDNLMLYIAIIIIVIIVIVLLAVVMMKKRGAPALEEEPMEEEMVPEPEPEPEAEMESEE